MTSKSRALAFLIGISMPLLTSQSWAQSEKPVPAPTAVLKAMKPRAINLRYFPLPASSDGEEARAHLYVVPPKNVPPAGTPFTRAYFIEPNVLPTPFPFYLDIFTQSGKTLKRRTSIVFHQQIYPSEIYTRWREPDKKRGLVLMLNFLIGNNGLWHVISLDDYLQPIARQQFMTAFDTAEADYNTRFVIDETDKRGFLKIGTLISEGEKKQAIWQEWQGTSFADPSAPYFVVAAIRKSRSAAEAFVAKQELQEYEIISTKEYRDYKGLPKNSYAVVITRCREEKQTREYKKWWDPVKKQYKKYTVLRAF